MTTTSFAGILQPLLTSLQRHTPAAGQLIGRDLVLPRPDTHSLLAIDAEGNIHLLLTPPAADPSRFRRFSMRSLTIGNQNWIVHGREAASYLDLACATARSPAFARPFLGFCEDVLTDIADSDALPEHAVHRACLRWRRFWTSDTSSAFTVDWVHGLAGELSFLGDLVLRHGPQTVAAWMGPEGKDHDFQVGTELAAEIKTSTAMPATIECNLNQLDPGIFGRLFLVCYHITPASEGSSLPLLAEAVEKALVEDEEALDLFWERLSKTGYRRELDERYREVCFSLSPPSIFRINEEFPALRLGSFRSPPDARIKRIRYSVQITGVVPEPNDVLDTDFARFGRRSET